MLFWDVFVRCLAVCCIMCDGICGEGAIVVGREISLSSFLAILWFSYEIICCIIFLRDFLKRCHAFLLLWDFLYDICRVLLHTLLMRCHALFALMRCPYEILCFSVNTFRTRYTDEISCLFGPLRALRMRFHAIVMFVCATSMHYIKSIRLFMVT
jgi:hypothetical protein